MLVIHLCIGSVFLYSPLTVLGSVFQGPPNIGDEQHRIVIWNLRLPRALAAALVGANLAIVGAAFQSLFRNPLADPYVLGVSSGAAVGGALAVAFGSSASFFGLGTVACAFAFAWLGLAAVLLLSRRAGGLSLATLLVSGVAVGTLLWALVTFVLVSAGQDAQKILSWLLGSLVGIDYPRVAILTGACAIGALAFARLARPLTIFATGEESAARLGVSVESVKRSTLAFGSLGVAATVACAGIVGFVGFFVPHVARRIFGADLRSMLPGAAILGALSVTFADLIAQRAVPGQEVNLGVVTAILGAPFLLFAVRRTG
jgi:iron complex transport system permease protein